MRFCSALVGLLLLGHAGQSQVRLGQLIAFSSSTTLGVALGYSRKDGLKEVIKTTGLAASLFISAVPLTNGVSMAGFFCSGHRCNGLAMATFNCVVDTTRGVALSLVGVGGRQLNGLSAALVTVSRNSWSTTPSTCTINGLALSGLTVDADTLHGVAVASYNRLNVQRGVCIGLLNRSEELAGVQLGLLNYAGNNPRLLRWLPGINVHW